MLDDSTLSVQIAQAQARLSDIASRLDRLPAAEREAVSVALQSLLNRSGEENAPTSSADPRLLISPTPEQQAALLNAISAGVLVYDRDQVIRFANKKAIQYIGYDPTSETRDHYMQQLKISDPSGNPLSIHEPPLNLVWQGIPVRDAPLMITNPHGQTFNVQVTAIPFFEDGALSGAIVIWNDVTLLEQAIVELKRQESQLRESEARFRVALAGTNIFVYTMDRELRYTWLYSPQYSDVVQRAYGKRNIDILPAAEVEGLEQLKRQVLESGVGVRKEISVMFNGVLHVFDMTFEPLRDSAGQISGLTGAAVDLTEQRRLEDRQNEYAARVQLHQRLMEQSEQDMLHFSRKLHDIALQGMISLITDLQLTREMVVDCSGPDGPAAGVIAEIETRARGLADELKRICNELNPPSPTRFGLKRAIQAYTRDLQDRYPGPEITLDLMEDILKLPEPVCLALYRIFREAIQNAAQHAAAKEISVRLSIHLREIVLEISDNGVGFTPAPNWTELVQKGQFGLVSIKEHAEAIHAAVALSSAPGEGTKVTVRAPYTE